MIVVICGVSGVGKTTVATRLAEALALPFVDADDFHPASNVEKMACGIPLDDEDRWPWLEALSDCIIEREKSGGAVLAFSALKESYRAALRSRCSEELTWIVLTASKEVLADRLALRQGHFFDSDLLGSQLEALEIPNYAWLIDAEGPTQEIVNTIRERIRGECTPEKELQSY